MEMLRGESEFGVDLLSHTVKESSKQQEATLATIQHPGYCNICQATSRLETVDIEAEECVGQEILCEM